MDRWEGRVAVVCDFAGSTTGLQICKDLTEHGLTVCGLTKHEGMRALEASVQKHFCETFLKVNFVL